MKSRSDGPWGHPAQCRPIRRPLILDFTDSCSGFASAVGGEVLDCKGMEGTSCYCDTQAQERLRAMLAPFQGGFHWIDSGDYHYVSKIFTDFIREDFALLLLDNHPDMQPPAFGQVLSCGGWLADALAGNGHLRKALAIGIDPSLRCEAEGFGEMVETLTSEELDGAGEAVRRLLGEGLPLYVSIDKDVLSPDYARTDWSQGRMTLDGLTALLRIVAESGRLATGHTGPDAARLLGCDLCGCLPVSKGGGGVDGRLNLQADLRIYEAVNGVFAH